MSNSRPRILYLTMHPLHGEEYGSQLRALHIGRLLQRCGKVGLVLMPFTDLDPAVLQQTRKEFDVKGVIRFQPSPARTVAGRLHHELNPYCTDTHGGQVDDKSAAAINRWVGEHDLIWFHGIRIPNNLGRKVWPSSILDIDDVPSQYHRSAMGQAQSFIARALDFRRQILWRRRENVLLRRFTILGVCSEQDKRYFGEDPRIHLIPNGYEMPATQVMRSPADPPRIGFIGKATYAPNADGIEWFISEVWPRIKAARSDARLRLVGKGTESFGKQRPDIDGLGWISDTAAEISTWSTMIVPIHVGGGTRVKVAEAFSRKCPIVSTRLGAYGYDVRDKEELLLADSSEEFATACLSIISNSALAQQLARRAWERFEQEWSWAAIGPKVERAVEACLRHACNGANQ